MTHYKECKCKKKLKIQFLTDDGEWTCDSYSWESLEEKGFVGKRIKDDFYDKGNIRIYKDKIKSGVYIFREVKDYVAVYCSIHAGTGGKE